MAPSFAYRHGVTKDGTMRAGTARRVSMDPRTGEVKTLCGNDSRCFRRSEPVKLIK